MSLHAQTTPKQTGPDYFMVIAGIAAIIAIVALLIVAALNSHDTTKLPGTQEAVVAQKGTYIYELGWEHRVGRAAMVLDNYGLRKAEYGVNCVDIGHMRQPYFCNNHLELAPVNTVLPGQAINVPHAGPLVQERLAGLAAAGAKGIILVVDLSDTGRDGAVASLYADALQPMASQAHPDGLRRKDGLYLAGVWYWDGVRVRSWDPDGPDMGVPAYSFVDAMDIAYSSDRIGHTFVLISDYPVDDREQLDRFSSMRLGLVQCTTTQSQSGNCQDADVAAQRSHAKYVVGS